MKSRKLRKKFLGKIRENDLIHTKKDSGTVIHVHTNRQAFVADMINGGITTITIDQLIDPNE